MDCSAKRGIFVSLPRGEGVTEGDERGIIINPEGRLPCVKSKACEARPVDDEASKVWRRGQNIQGKCRRIFWSPQEFAPDEVG